MLSRAGISALKTRLLLGIDELERRAEAYGIGTRLRCASHGVLCCAWLCCFGAM